MSDENHKLELLNKMMERGQVYRTGGTEVITKGGAEKLATLRKVTAAHDRQVVHAVNLNDANDTASVCEAASRPHMNFVPPKTLAQQGMLCVHRLREALKEERTVCINRIRGLPSSRGSESSPRRQW